MSTDISDLIKTLDTLGIYYEDIKLTDNDVRLNFGIETDSSEFNYYDYIEAVKSRGNLPYSISDISKIESKQTKTCKRCAYFRGEFGDKYLCKRPSSSVNLNNCFVSKKELDSLDFCIDFKFDQMKAEKFRKSEFKFNNIFDKA